MGEVNDDFYRRQEDQRWREKIDERLASLTTDTMVIQDRIEECEEKLLVLDLSVRGDAAKETGGLIERLHDLEGKISRLWAVIFMDATGEHGMYEEWKRLQRKEHKDEVSLEVHWKFYTAVAVAFISTFGLIMTNIDKIKRLVHPEKPAIVRPQKKVQRKVRPVPIVTYPTDPGEVQD